LHRAVFTGDIDLVSAVLSAGRPVNVLDPAGETALSVAVELGHTDIARLLVDNLANPSISDRYGMLPWEVAARNGEQLLAFRLLPNSGRGGHATDWLFLAAEAGDVEALRLAFSAGGDSNALNHQGQTVLQVALINQHWSVIQYFLNLPTWARANALHEEDVSNLLYAALLPPDGSPSRHFAVRAIEAFLNREFLEPSHFLNAAPPGTTNETLRQLMQDIGLPLRSLDAHFPAAIARMPALEYQLPRAEPAGGITQEHWREVQLILRNEGLYDGPIDGIPGTGTFDGLYAYVIGLAPVIIERVRATHGMAIQGQNGYGQLRVRTRGGEYRVLHGRVIRSESTDVAVGYLSVSSDQSPDRLETYQYAFRSIPRIIRSGWRAQAVSVNGCATGRVTSVSASLFGEWLSIQLGDRHTIMFPGVERYRLPQDVPGDAPIIPCN
jgi:hypothetical protein